jgi:hypothetical protein
MKKLFALIKQLTCKHVFIDLRKIGFERCIWCSKEKKKNYEN